MSDDNINTELLDRIKDLETRLSLARGAESREVDARMRLEAEVLSHIRRADLAESSLDQLKEENRILRVNSEHHIAGRVWQHDNFTRDIEVLRADLVRADMLRYEAEAKHEKLENRLRKSGFLTKPKAPKKS